MPIEINGYPLTHEACAISLGTDGSVILHMPGQRAEQHTIKLTPDANGMKVLVKVLTERARAKPDENTIRAEMNAPTQLVVNEWLKHNAVKVHEKPTKEPDRDEMTPSEVDEILEGIEL